VVELGSVCLRRLGAERSVEVAFGRFLRNQRVNAKEMLEYTAAQLEEAARGLHVLALQDTTELNYQAHAKRVTGLGKVGNGKDAGFFLHPILAVDAQSHAILGLCGAHIWQRHHGKAPQYQQLPIEEKESFRWLIGAEQAKESLRQAEKITIIADRESDIYEEWARIPDEKTHLLNRICRNRALVQGGTLYEWCDMLSVQHRYSLELRQANKTRLVELEIRFSPVEIKRPGKCSDPLAPPQLKLYVVDVREVNPIDQAQAIHWRLMTTHAVETIENALTIIDWYCQRWHIEQIFRTMKRQGLDIESSQVETAVALEKLVVIALIGAVKTLQLVNARDGTSNRPATDVFTPRELTVLRNLQPQLEGKTEAQKNRFPRDSLAWSTWIIARLGGWKGYKSERPPGPITLHNGLKAFGSIVQGWYLAKENEA
jgi:hypothetical protein